MHNLLLPENCLSCNLHRTSLEYFKILSSAFIPIEQYPDPPCFRNPKRYHLRTVVELKSNATPLSLNERVTVTVGKS